MDAINTPGVIPNVQTAWETFVVTKCTEASHAALQIYDATMTEELAGQLPCDSDKIRQTHELALEKGVTRLEAEIFGMSAITIEKYLKELTVSILTYICNAYRCRVLNVIISYMSPVRPQLKSLLSG